jgi:hypothetical protein
VDGEFIALTNLHPRSFAGVCSIVLDDESFKSGCSRLPRNGHSAAPQPGPQRMSASLAIAALRRLLLIAGSANLAIIVHLNSHPIC